MANRVYWSVVVLASFVAGIVGEIVMGGTA